MVGGSFCYALVFLLLVIHTSPAVSQTGFCTDPPDAEGKAFLALHNFVSSNVDPPAANMNLYSWDPVLHLMATKIAKDCIRGNAFKDYDDMIGVNAAYTTLPPSENQGRVVAIVNAWASERKNYDYDRNFCATGKRCDRWGQIVWAKTKYLGCSISPEPCRNGKYLAVCLYSPEGNIDEERPYITGEPCTQCEPGRTRCVNNLCAP